MHAATYALKLETDDLMNDKLRDQLLMQANEANDDAVMHEDAKKQTDRDL